MRRIVYQTGYRVRKRTRSEVKEKRVVSLSHNICLILQSYLSKLRAEGAVGE